MFYKISYSLLSGDGSSVARVTTSTFGSVLYDLTKHRDLFICIEGVSVSLKWFYDHFAVSLGNKSLHANFFKIFQFLFELSLVLSLYDMWKSWNPTGQMCTSMFNDLISVFHLLLYWISWEELVSMHFWWSIWWKSIVNFVFLPPPLPFLIQSTFLRRSEEPNFQLVKESNREQEWGGTRFWN